MTQFSEQQLVECDLKCYGCSGGKVSWANKYLKDHNAILESVYPYTADAVRCRYKELETTDVHTKGSSNLKSKSP